MTVDSSFDSEFVGKLILKLKNDRYISIYELSEKMVCGFILK